MQHIVHTNNSFTNLEIYVHEQIENHNSLGYERPSCLDVKQSPSVQDAFRPIPGLISCAEVTGSVGITRHAHTTQMAGLIHVHVHWYIHVLTCITVIAPHRPEEGGGLFGGGAGRPVKSRDIFAVSR